MEQKYSPKSIEQKWQRYWESSRAFQVGEDPDKEKYYLLEMFPYPSGRIHMGHVRNYTIGDVVARFMRMRGYNVLHPMGWDAFGMPAENAAIKAGTHPAKWTYDNIDYMRNQLKQLGFSYDWSREIATCNPDYYRWEQLFFLKMFDLGLAYRKSSYVNWCSKCQTVLANEQVENGVCWRCDTEVVQKEMEQWFFRITHYVDELLDNTFKMDGWPERVLVMQQNWIGKSTGSMLLFPLESGDGKIQVFTTRADTLFGATFLSLAAEHPMVSDLCRGKPQEAAVLEFVQKAKQSKRNEREADLLEKEGVFTGSYCLNPVTGKKMPIYVANFVLMAYGTGAVMAVPAHDQRDFEFARKYGLPIDVVIKPAGADPAPSAGELTRANEEYGILVNSAEFTAMASEPARVAITESLAKKGLAELTVQHRLRDWGISRQRYWGAPIPIVYCQKCGAVPVAEKDLPVVLPLDVELLENGGSPLPVHKPFYSTQCPKCGGEARRETDTMDTFVESSWYFARYSCPDFDKGPLDKERVAYWMPVDQYIGGIEHAVLHLLYSRFFVKVLRDLGYLQVDEPFKNLLTQGMVIKDGFKMSKSKGNVVDPDVMIRSYGADTVRLFCLFAAPPEKDLDWSDQGVEGSFRFLSRMWRLVSDNFEPLKSAAKGLSGHVDSDGLPPDLAALRRKTHQTIKKVTEDIRDRFHFNTAIAAVMELVNQIYQTLDNRKDHPLFWPLVRQAVEAVIVLSSPMVPHACEELWQTLGHQKLLLDTPWPQWDERALEAEEMLIVVQINGKLRSRISVPADATDKQVEQLCLADPRVAEFIAGKQPRKVVVVPKKLINIVI
ncbi:MAG: leucine--tRNA ligase [Syntrophobacteraceae bacterium]|nr:leucine--tRNA ligase [Syntrophobacteraceae bacterium]